MSGLGWATWDQDEWDDLVAPVEFGTLYPTSNEDWLQEVFSIVGKLQDRISWRRVKAVYCEEPVYFGSLRGDAAARGGSLVKLSVAVGAITQMCKTQAPHADVELVAVRDWMGQLAEETMRKRITKRLGEEATKKVKSHAWDAVGIGLYKKGYF
jgi:hypothetical protein